MSIEDAADNIGRVVVYRGHSFGNQSGQQGIITSVNATYVFVRYAGNQTSQATRPQDIEFL